MRRCIKLGSAAGGEPVAVWFITLGSGAVCWMTPLEVLHGLKNDGVGHVSKGKA